MSSDYVEFASENYGDGNLADSNNKNPGNTPAEIQRNQKFINNNNQDYAGIDKSKGEDLVFTVPTITAVGFCCCCLLSCHHHSFLRQIQHNR
jgi:hypothetical protein